MKSPPKILIELDWKAIIALFVLVFVIGTIEARRRSAEIARLESQNARILQILESGEEPFGGEAPLPNQLLWQESPESKETGAQAR